MEMDVDERSDRKTKGVDWNRSWEMGKGGALNEGKIHNTFSSSLLVKRDEKGR